MHSIVFDTNLGGNFLDWSIFYLSGFDEYWSIKSSKFLPVTKKPLTNINSHNHISNQIIQDKDVNFFLKNIKKVENFSIIFHQVYSFETIKKKCHWKENITADIIEKIKILPENKIIFLKNSQPNVLYNSVDSPRSGIFSHGPFKNANSKNKEFVEAFINHFFDEDYKTWKSKNLDSIWDKREFIALNFRPFDREDRLENIVKHTNFDYFPINDTNLWTSLDLTLPRLFEFLERPLHYKKLEKWKTIYSEWKKKHIQVLQFCWYFDEIIDAILQNRYICLESFNLDLTQEATIQHTLMYKYGLNFKTWKLEKFKDTKQLHNLLESNIHF